MVSKRIYWLNHEFRSDSKRAACVDCKKSRKEIEKEYERILCRGKHG